MSPGLIQGPDAMDEISIFKRITRFIVVISLTLTIIYGILPWLTNSFDVLNHMSQSLDESGINPTSYFYTDVEQVFESEQYLQIVLDRQ